MLFDRFEFLASAQPRLADFQGSTYRRNSCDHALFALACLPAFAICESGPGLLDPSPGTLSLIHVTAGFRHQLTTAGLVADGRVIHIHSGNSHRPVADSTRRANQTG